jgi:plastocyanin
LSPRGLVCGGALALASFLLISCSASEGNRVTLDGGFRFEPEETVVEAGTTVTFVNESSTAHTVTADESSLPPGVAYFGSGGFASESAARENMKQAFIQPGETYRVTLERPGTYRYVCIPHESTGMRGSIVVEG